MGLYNKVQKTHGFKKYRHQNVDYRLGLYKLLRYPNNKFHPNKPNKPNQPNKQKLNCSILSRASINPNHKVNQDRCSVGITNGIKYYAVYDGHGRLGERVSSYLQTHLVDDLLLPNLQHNRGGNLVQFPLRSSFIEDIFSITEKRIIDCDSYAAFTGGSTALVVLDFNSQLQIINLGDCRVMIFNGDGVRFCSQPHRPDTIAEISRILKIDDVKKLKIWRDGNDMRIGRLAVSRAFGDTDTLPYITHIPDILVVDKELTDQYMIIASDGFWDFISSNNVFNIIKNNPNPNGLTKLSYLLYNEVIKNGSNDDVTICVVKF